MKIWPKLSTAGLETGEQQIAFLDGMNKDEQLQMLAEALDESAEGRAEMEKLHRQWREGDAQGMWQGHLRLPAGHGLSAPCVQQCGQGRARRASVAFELCATV